MALLSSLFLGIALVACEGGSTPPSGGDMDGGAESARSAEDASTTPCGDAAALPPNPPTCPTFEQGCRNGAFTCTDATLECFYELPTKDKATGCPARARLRCTDGGGGEGASRFQVSCGLL